MNNELKDNTVRTLTLMLINNQQIHENIKFADTKAAFFFTLNSGLVALIYTMRPGSTTSTDKLFVFLQLIVCGLLAVGDAFTIAVIWPRGRESRSRGTGLIDAERIFLYGDARLFHEECCTVKDDDILRETSCFTFDRARINRQKYVCLRNAIAVSSAGWLGALLICAGMKFLQV